MRVMSKETMETFNSLSKSCMSVGTLEKILSIKVAIAIETFGVGTMAHTYAVMACKMLDEIKEFLDGYEVNEILFEEVSKVLNEDETLEL